MVQLSIQQSLPDAGSPEASAHSEQADHSKHVQRAPHSSNEILLIKSSCTGLSTAAHQEAAVQGLAQLTSRTC